MFPLHPVLRAQPKTDETVAHGVHWLMLTTILLGMCTFFLLSCMAMAQDYQPGRTPLAYVREVMAVPQPNYPVILTGYIVKNSGDEKYIFRDTTGTLQADIPEEALYNISVDGRRLTLRGIIDIDGDVVEIDVTSVSAAE